MADPDRDGDGVPDATDRCPALAGLATHGCPPGDRDGDQVLDAADRCPDQPGPKSNRGCPDSDGDGDGVYDRYDKCKQVAGHPDFDGCPLPDRDGDGIADREDRCPDRAERWNGKRDRDGCPDRGRALLAVSKGVITFPARVRFTRDRAVRAVSHWPLRIAASLLRRAKAHIVTVAVVAPHGLSYGHSLMRARWRAQAVRARLAKAARMRPERIRLLPLGPDGRPRVEIRYR